MSVRPGPGAPPPGQPAWPAAARGAAPTPGFASRFRAAFGGASVAHREAILAERVEILLGIAQRLARTLDRREIFRTIVDESNRILQADAKIGRAHV